MRGWSLEQTFWSLGHLPALIRFCQWLTKENPLEFSQTTFSHYVAQLMREAGLAKEKADLCVDEIQVRSLATKMIRTLSYIYYHHYYHILSLLWLLIIVIVIMMIIIIYTYTHECLLQTSSGGIAFIVYFFVYSVCLCPGAGSTLPLCRHRSNKTHEAQEKMVFTSVWGVALFVWRLQPSGMNLACP